MHLHMNAHAQATVHLWSLIDFLWKFTLSTMGVPGLELVPSQPAASASVSSTITPAPVYGISDSEVNHYLTSSLLQSGKPPINDMFSDLKDGRKLLDLLEGLTGTSLVRGHFYFSQTGSRMLQAGLRLCS